MTKKYKPLKVKVRKIDDSELDDREKSVAAFYDAVSKDYYKQHKGRFCDDILEYFILHFLPKPPVDILDLGGGIGRFAVPLAKKGNTVLLYDLSDGMLESAKKIAAKQKVNLDYKKGSLTDLGSLASENFNAVISLNSALDYCRDYKNAFSEIFRVLKKEGIFIGSVNNRFAYATANALKQGDLEVFVETMKTGNHYIHWGNAIHGHITHDFTQEELSSAIKEAGLKNVKILGVFNLLGKYFHSYDILEKLDNDPFFKLQLEYAQKPEYINNSTDFFFVCNK